MNSQEKPKEKSVLTYEEIMSFVWKSHEYPDGLRDMIRDVEQKVLANYKKELREKVQERLDLIKGDEGRYREGQESVFLWLLRELGDG